MRWEHVPLLYRMALEKATSHPLHFVRHIIWRVGRLTALQHRQLLPNSKRVAVKKSTT
ncbi:hypothetical protein BDP81DRAFT_177575 [Colletotrichum phormii]|uniref:Uncharacterized protein n=1 Tax=Colletotrichum phormii TaxID=359342 RepID=A0AAI9ZWF2_9PEZI|nr:uncharacterized protein BDP81DRAFT_177575 [Colletotrichum phormii]KAK1639462.1 hypothetical protein BDP81DRAFT_177575 [Colletotrichum phormii]